MTWTIESTPYAHGGIFIRDASGWIVADTTPEHAALLAAAPAMLAALRAIQPEIERTAADVLDCCAELGADGRPDRATTDAGDAASVAEVEGMLAAVNAAIEQATLTLHATAHQGVRTHE